MGSGSSSGARPVLAVAVAGLIIAGCGASSLVAPTRPAPSLRLVAYDDCGELLDGLRRATAAHIGPYGLGGDPVMRPLAGGRVPGDPTGGQRAATPHSQTNVQEPGVDEPDQVKTDGRRIVTVARGRLVVIDAASRRQTGSLDLREGRAWPAGELMLYGDRALVVLRPAITFARVGVVDGPETRRVAAGPRLLLVDLRGAPRVVSSTRLGGSYVDARRTGPTARIVMRSAPRIMVLSAGSSGVRRLGSVRQPDAAGPVQRALLVGGTLWTLSASGLQANDAATLAKTAWLPLPPA
jgi:hypothetical protein